MLPRYNCKRCKHTWIPRSDNKPTICPKCKTPYWDKEYTNKKEGDEDKTEVTC